MIKLHDIEQGSAEWLEARKGKFTGSNAYKLLGSHGANEYAQAIEGSFKGNFYTKRGHILEDEAIELYEAITKQRVTHTGYVTNTDYPDCLYSPDGLLAGDVIEVKCFGEKPHMKIINGDIDIKILAQIHFGMMICGKKAAQLVIYNPELAPELALKIIPIKFNRNIQNNFKRILSPGKAPANAS